MEITPAMSAAPLFRQISAEDLGELLTFTTEALPDTAAALRDPAQFAE